LIRADEAAIDHLADYLLAEGTLDEQQILAWFERHVTTLSLEEEAQSMTYYKIGTGQILRLVQRSTGSRAGCSGRRSNDLVESISIVVYFISLPVSTVEVL
jgi:hypothetical protein